MNGAEMEKLDKILKHQEAHSRTVNASLSGIRETNAAEFSGIKADIGHLKEQGAGFRKETKESLTQIHERINENAEEITEARTRLDEHMKDGAKHPDAPRSSMHLQAQSGGLVWTPQKVGAAIIGGTIIVLGAGWKLVEVIKELLTSSS